METAHLKACAAAVARPASGSAATACTAANLAVAVHPVEYSLLRDIRMHEPVAEQTWSGRHVRM